MLEKLYTTKMSADKKTMENRFTKIRSTSTRNHKVMATLMTIAVIITMFCANVVMATFGNSQSENIRIYNNGEEIELINKAFVENGNVYVPLREVIEKIVSENDGITDIKWNNGTIDVKIAYYQGESGIYQFNIGGSYMKTKHFTYSEFNNVSIDNTSVIISKNLKQSPILKSSTTYVTVEDINYMLFRFTNRRDENKKLYGLTYSIFDKDGNIIDFYNNPALYFASQTDVTTSRYANDTPEYTIEQFYNLFSSSNFDNMKNYCTQYCIDTFFRENSVFGMTQASLSQMYINPKEYTNLSNNINALIEVNMLPSENSVYDSTQTTATFYMVLEKQDDGRYLINEFSTGV